MNRNEKILAEFEKHMKDKGHYRPAVISGLCATLGIILATLPTDKEIAKGVILKWVKGKVYQEEELKAINDCRKWLNKEIKESKPWDHEVSAVSDKEEDVNFTECKECGSIWIEKE